MNYRQLSEQVQLYVQTLFKAELRPGLLYHNLQHTENVVSAATRIANHYQLSDHDFFVVIAAAWFHDIGYLDGAKDHEEKGAREAATVLADLQVNEAAIKAIQQCILATRMPQNPNNLFERILCDADLFHLGTDDFADKNKQLRKEVQFFCQKEISKEEWRAKTIELLQKHHYFTDYCQILLEAKKQENLLNLLAKQHTAVKQSPVKDEKMAKSMQESETGGKKKTDRPERGIETMFRISSSNHQRLSDMADNKSHIIITVNSIIISVVVSLLLRKLDTNDYLTIPAIMLLVVSLIAIVLSILATRPKLPQGVFSKADLDEKKVNLLFFGNFYNMSLDSYTQGMLKVMDDRDFLYRMLIRDIYSQGVVLGRKYKLLRASYNVFMFGLIVSVIAFIVASLFTTASIN